MKSIYVILENSCCFLKELGYSYCCNIKSFIHPSVLFSSLNERLQIGIDFETNRMFCNRYDKSDDIHSIDLLINIDFRNCKTANQVIETGIENLKKIIKINKTNST